MEWCTCAARSSSRTPMAARTSPGCPSSRGAAQAVPPDRHGLGRRWHPLHRLWRHAGGLRRQRVRLRLARRDLLSDRRDQVSSADHEKQLGVQPPDLPDGQPCLLRSATAWSTCPGRCIQLLTQRPYRWPSCCPRPPGQRTRMYISVYTLDGTSPGVVQIEPPGKSMSLPGTRSGTPPSPASRSRSRVRSGTTSS